MEHFIMSVRDSKSEAYGRPFFTPSIGTAIRSFADEVNNNREDNMLFSHPEDFTLFTLGKFDDTTGTFETCTPKVLLIGDQAKVRKGE